MRTLTALVVAGLLLAAAAGCHEKKTESTTPGSTMGDAGAKPAVQYPPAQ